MHFISLSLAITTLLTTSLATPINPRSTFFSDTYDDVSSILTSTTPCRPVALLFARGTFDSGNVGVWVGPQLIASLQSLLPDPSHLAAQGVNSTAYPASLSGYLTEGGSNDGAASLAATARAYAAQCPDSAIVVSGWSQGALVAHKALAQLEPDVLQRVAGVVTFGDPWHLFSAAGMPEGIDEQTVKGYCFDGTILDPLCAPLPAGFEVPETLEGVTAPFAEMPGIAHGVQQVKAAASLVVRFPGQLMDSWSSFVGAFQTGDFVRLLLTPEHFEYGNRGFTTDAAEFIAQLPLVKKALAA